MHKVDHEDEAKPLPTFQASQTSARRHRVEDKARASVEVYVCLLFLCLTLQITDSHVAGRESSRMLFSARQDTITSSAIKQAGLTSTESTMQRRYQMDRLSSKGACSPSSTAPFVMDVGRELSALRLTSSLRTGRTVSHEVNLSQLRVDLTQSLGHASSPNVRLADRGELFSLWSSLIDSVLSPQRPLPFSGRPISKLNTSMDAMHDSANRLKRTSAVGGSRPTSAISVLQDTGDLSKVRLRITASFPMVQYSREPGSDEDANPGRLFSDV
jgi:hypothetical protein